MVIKSQSESGDKFPLRSLYDYQDSVIEHRWPTDSGLLSFLIMAAGDIYRELTADRICDCGYISEKIRFLNGINRLTVGDFLEIRDTRMHYQDYPARLKEFLAKVERLEQMTWAFSFGEYSNRRKALLLSLHIIKQLCDWGITGYNSKVEGIRKSLVELEKEINILCRISLPMQGVPVVMEVPAPKRVFKREGKLEINPLLLQAFGITPEELGDVIKSAEEPEAMRDMFAFLSDYATLSDPKTRLTISGDKLDFLVADLKRRMAYVERVYRSQAEDYSKFYPETAKQLLKISERARELYNFKGMSREDKVEFIDAVVGLEHTSGSIIPIAFGISDYGREDYWPRKLLAFLRSHGMPRMVREGTAPDTGKENIILLPLEQAWKMRAKHAYPGTMETKRTKEAMERLRNEMKQGRFEPIPATREELKSGILTEGKHRLIVAKELGIKQVPIKIIESNKSPELSGLNLKINWNINVRDGMIVYMPPEEGKVIGGVSMISEAITPAPEPADKEFRANPGLINKQAAYVAHVGTSFEPEKRGEQAIRGFADEVQAMYERLKPHARTDAEKALLISEMERFQTSYAQKYNDLLYSHSRIYSTMIAGPSGFPTERMRKINEAYDKKAQETNEWKDRAEKAMLRALKGLATEEAGGELAVLKNKIAQAEKLQEMMVEANKIIRKKAEPGIGGISKHQQLINMGFTERQAREAMTPDYMGRTGFPAFALQNNSANIRRMKERLIELEKREVTPTAEIPFAGGYIVDNREEDRVQIFFDQKPPQAMIDKLKSEGWRWAPSVGAWSRKRTDMALNSARRITGAAAPAVQPPAVPQVPVQPSESMRKNMIEKKEPWEMTYREFADLFEEVWGGMKFNFAERVGKPLGIQSQAGEPYHMIKGRRIGYSGSLARDRWRLAIVDKALSGGKKVPEDILAELSESLKHEREKLGGTGMAELYEEKPPDQEVRDWMKRALGIEDYKGGRHDRIQMLALLIQNSELGNIRSISDSGSMALALGKDLGYGTPPAYGKSLERYYAEKIAVETGKEVPIIKSSAIIKPPVKITDVKAAFEKHFIEYNRLSLLALTQLNDVDLAENITTEIQGLSREDALKVAPQMRSLMESRIKELEEQEVKARPPAPEVPKVDFWGMVKDLKITDVQVEFAPGEPSRGYKNIYLYTYALLENGKRVRMNEEMFKGHDVAEVQKMGEEQFRKRKLYMIGETVEKNMRESSFLFLNRYEEYVKQAPVAVQKRFEESGAIAGGTPARHILRITEPEEYYFGTQIEVLQGANPELEPYFTGTIKRLLNNGELVEVHPEGDPREVSFRVPVDRVNVIRLVHQGEPKEIKKLSRYYYSHRPPGIGTQPEGYINYESWLPAATTPHGRTAFGWVEYDRPLTPEEISGYELFEDEVELPKLVRELVQFARDEGIDEAMKAIDAEYGRAVWDWLKAQKRIRAGLGQKEQIRNEIIRLAGITATEREESSYLRLFTIEKPLSIQWVTPDGRVSVDWFKNGKEVELFFKANLEAKLLRIHQMEQYGMGQKVEKTLYDDAVGRISIRELYSRIKTEQAQPPITLPPAAPPAIQARFNAYIRSTVLTTGALASPKFLSDEKMAQDIERNIQVSKDEARALVPQFRAMAEKKINKEEVESIKELFGIDLEQEAHKLGIDLADYAIIKAGSRVILHHKTIVQRRYEIKSPAGFMKKQEEETQEKLREAQRRKALAVQPAVPSAAKPVQSIQEVKQQVLDSIQVARSVEELQPVLKGIGFLPLPEPEKRQVMDAYQNRYSILMSERPFGVSVKAEEKPKAIGAPTPQQRFEEEQRRKAAEKRGGRAKPKLTGGVSTSRRLSEFGIKERMLPELTESMLSYIQGAQAVKDVMHYFRDGRTPTRGVLYRTRDGRYFVEANDGQIYDSMGWEDVEAQPQAVREPARYAGAAGL